MTDLLFSVAEGPSRRDEGSGASGEPRVQRPNRTQLELRPVDLEGVLPADHRARLVWEFIEGLDLQSLYDRIKALEGQAGRPAIDPAILVALWLYATLDGVGSARALARLCEAHDAYRWICGGVGVNYHTLADFRVGHDPVLDRLLTQSVAALRATGRVSMQRVAQDGMRVRASAGSGSFRRRGRVERLLAEAAAQVQALRQELADDPAATSRRQTAARERAARERHERVSAALAQLPALEAQAARRAAREGGRYKEPRVSTTAADARVMKQADGGFRPAYNAQFATDTGSQVIVGVAVTNAGADVGHLGPMLEQLHRRYGETPAELLVDGGYIGHTDFEYVAGPALGCTLYAPVPAPRGASHRRREPRESPVLTAWRARMATPEAQTIYKQRAATAECVNAQARQRGLRHVMVRGLRKVYAVALWYALAHNMVRAVALGPPAEQWA
jgi:transposase